MYKSFSSRWRSEDTYENTYLYTMYQGFFKSWTSEATHFACTHCSKDVYQTVHLMGPCAQRQTLFLNLEIWSYIWKCFASRQCSKALSLNIWSSIWEHTREKHLHVYNVQKLFLMLLIWRVKWKKQSGQKPFACIQQVNVSNGRSDTLLVFISFYSSMIWSFVADSRGVRRIFSGGGGADFFHRWAI